MTTPRRKSTRLDPEDYYFDNGFVVFTAAYHLKRGYCCDNECRHCPWSESCPLPAQQAAQQRHQMQQSPAPPAAPAELQAPTERAARPRRVNSSGSSGNTSVR